jgi:hypothetical protein
MDLQEAFRIARRIPSSRIVSISAAGSYLAEEIRESDDFCVLAESFSWL